jgi:hypothetical protein
MAIVQEAFDIPSDIMIKILTGEYKRIGGVVRQAIGPNKGQIVKHLKPVDIKEAEKAKSLAAKALQFAKNNKKALIIVGVSTGVAIAVAGTYYIYKNHESKVVTDFRASLRAYTNAIRKGILSLVEINNLMISLEAVKAHKEYEKISIKLSAEDLSVLVSLIYEYTLKLAQDNPVNIIDEDLFMEPHSDDVIINLQRYLKTQKQIFEEAA